MDVETSITIATRYLRARQTIRVSGVIRNNRCCLLVVDDAEYGGDCGAVSCREPALCFLDVGFDMLVELDSQANVSLVTSRSKREKSGSYNNNGKPCFAKMIRARLNSYLFQLVQCYDSQQKVQHPFFKVGARRMLRMLLEDSNSFEVLNDEVALSALQEEYFTVQYRGWLE